MDSESDKPLRLFVNPFAIWTQLALKTGEAMWASAHAVAVRASARKVAVIPPDAPPTKAQGPATSPARPSAEKLLETAHAVALKKAKAAVRPSKAASFKANRAKLRSKVSSKRRVKR